MSLGTQWRMGMGGPVGLDYGVMFHKMDRMHLSDKQYDQLEADMQTLESTALQEMHAK